jgi:hypothetical protein
MADSEDLRHQNISACTNHKGTATVEQHLLAALREQ